MAQKETQNPMPVQEPQVSTQEAPVPPEVYVPNAEDKKDHEKVQGSGKIVVALCHPHGISFDVDGGKRRVVIKGNAANLFGQPKGVLPEGGFGLTEVAESDWEQIKKNYSDMEIFKNGLIFASDKKSDVLAEADEKAELRHGREPVSVDGDDRQSQSEPM